MAAAAAHSTPEVNRLRPIERCILRLTGRGMADAEIAQRLHRSPDYVVRVKALVGVPRSGRSHDGGRHDAARLRPIERCILRWRERGEDYIDVAARFHRSPSFVEFVEELAEYKLSR